MESDSRGEAPASGVEEQAELDPGQRWRVSIQPGGFGLSPIARYGRQPRRGDVLMPANTEAQRAAEVRLRDIGRVTDTFMPLPKVIQYAFLVAEGEARASKIDLLQEVYRCLYTLLGEVAV